MASAAILLAACGGTPPPDTGDQTTLTMHANENGQLEYCDADGRCHQMPNPLACATLIVVIDTVSGQTCETCEDAAGNVLSNSCQDTQIACVVVTAPEPDCVVCAHIGGAVIYSSCVVEEPSLCEEHVLADGSACRVCRDEYGQVILDECPVCNDLICPMILCAEGYVAVQRPGECCPTCLPSDDCENVLCAQIGPVPECPPGTELVRDPADCCAYYCQPTECPIDPTTGGGGCIDDADCAPGETCWDGWCAGGSGGNDGQSGGGDAGVPCSTDHDCNADQVCVAGLCTGPDHSEPTCPPGYEPRYEFPYCGQCQPIDEWRYCFSDAECAAGEYCAYDPGFCALPYECGCWEECNDAGECTTICADCACPGVCQPIDWQCPQWMPPSDDACQGGTWEYGGFDEQGCPLPPLCVCADGTIPADGVCRDSCADVYCPAVLIECEPGYHLEYGYPYCCGICVPDVLCFADPCQFTDCGPGYTCTQGPNCEAICEPSGCDWDGWSACAAMLCGPGSICELDENCQPSCVPYEATCYSDYDCGVGELCSTSRGDCRQPPGCDAGDTCIDVCAGVCEPAGEGLCNPKECGPQLGMPNYECADGTWAGPTGRCLRHDDQSCGWEVLTCE